MTVTTLMGEMYVRGAIWGGATICAVRVYRGGRLEDLMDGNTVFYFILFYLFL